MMAEFWGFDQVDREGLVFISYNSLDWKRVAPIALELRKLGLPVWYDYGLEAGREDWERQIARHIRISNALVIFVTEGIFERKDSYVMWEYNIAKGLDKPIVPVFLDNVLSDAFYQKWAKEQPDSFDKYSTNFIRWKMAEGVIATPGETAAQIAAEIKKKFDRSSQLTYTPEPWSDAQAEMKRKAEEAKARADREAQAEKARQAADEKARTQAKPTVRVGSRVQFGRYPQSTNDPEPIVWRVLDIIDGRALMISEDLLDAHRFDASSNDWRKSELRAWLNKDFMNKAFSAAERRQLGNMSGDKVTCLSVEEVEKYFSDATQEQKVKTGLFTSDTWILYPDRMAKPTAYARKNSAYVDSHLSTGWWWLRSPGSSSGRAAYVISNGDILGDIYGSVDDDSYCVRPVVFASL